MKVSIFMQDMIINNTPDTAGNGTDSCNSAMVVAGEAGPDNPRLNLTGWSDIKFIERHGAFSIYTASRYGRKYFLKSLSEDHRDLQEWQRLLFKEFELGIQLDHPGIVRTVAWEKVPNVGEALVTEYVDGLELREWLKADNGHTPEERLNVVKQIVEALKYIHSIGISHRDLKPDNILITHKGSRVKIIDFGLGDGDDFIVYKQAAGTKAYGAPEQMKGPGETVSMSADIYSLGKIMRIMLPGLRYRRLIGKCLRKEATSRLSAAEVLKSLNRGSRIRSLAISLPIVTLIAVVALLLNQQYARDNGNLIPFQPTVITDTLYIQKTDTVGNGLLSQPSEASIKAVWNKAIKDIDPQIKFFATYNFPNPEEHRNDINELIADWGEHLYLSLLEIGCTEENATSKRKELGSYMRRRFSEYRASIAAESADSLTIQ